MQRMTGLGRFMKFPPSAAKIVLLNKVLLQPLRKFRQRVRTAHPLPQPGAKTSPKWRDTSMFEDIPSKRLHDGPETPLAEEVSQVGPSLAGQDVVPTVARKDDSRGAVHLAILALSKKKKRIVTRLRRAPQRIFPTLVGETGSTGKNLDIHTEILCNKRRQDTFLVVEHGPAVDRVSAQRAARAILPGNLAGHRGDAGRIESTTHKNATRATRQPVAYRLLQKFLELLYVFLGPFQQ